MRSCDFSGPADGRQLALKVPGLTIQTMVAQGSFLYVLTQATVDVHSSQVVEIGVFPFWRFRGSCGPGLVSLSRVFPAVLWGAVSLSFSLGVSNGSGASRVES